MLYNQFYSELGKLLYAVADVDGLISAKEKKALHELVKKELVVAEKNTDEFGTDAAWYAEFEFDFMDETIAEPEAAFESFINFIEEHKTAISISMLIASKKAALQLSRVYYHTNIKEKQLLKKLNRIINMLLKEKSKITLNIL